MRFSLLPAALLGLLLAGCQNNSTSADDGITAAIIGRHLQRLASDEFQGRKPFTAGETKTTEYLAGEFKKLGLQPGPGGSYFQNVPLVEIDATPAPTMQLKGKGQPLTLRYKQDFVAVTRQEQPRVSVDNSPVVFVGYGVVAPEYGWDDYAGVDIKGKTVVVLINDPGFIINDPKLFKGKAMTYYGRWTYKYEEAAAHGAAAVLLVHDTKPASYPWSVVESSWSGTQLYPENDAPNSFTSSLQGWITLDATKRLLAAAGQDYAQLLKEANSPGFKPRELGLNLSASLTTKVRRMASKNVVAVLPGTERPDEYVLYTAHWDHLGIGPAVQGDSIYNGAVDNASGCAALLNIAQAFAQAKEKPKRSIVFLAVTGEEQGLLGSAYYAAHPLFPLNKTVADLNMDALGSFGPMKDLTVVGFGQSELDDYASAAAKEQDRYIVPDQTPEQGHFFRSDHFSLAHVGVPALYASGRVESRAKGKDFAKQQNDLYEEKHYHQPSDEYRPDMDLGGMAEDARLLYRIGRRLGDETTFPQWKPGSEFKAIRDRSMPAKPQA
ncbi:M28 family metallopeptidase [Hymenobacter jeollabukensis]|uniref:M20/M25/M40 family metallo-hydrolase n=1 Tax=Hymenobacter jeollabukensis TaxID=2025313 RepID=A0A5R8WUF3_9BACT|nr:M28 family metallopeptidase [Hymenobacter jeollabukensis]TLM95045.1 M20/M25/M40 family metallo-hydrolase [Hymenobacter jeollabukensis]